MTIDIGPMRFGLEALIAQYVDGDQNRLAEVSD